MNTDKLNRIMETTYLSEAYLDNLVRKMSANERRKQKFGDGKEPQVRKRHWSNHAGTYRRRTQGRAPKYYHSSLPPKVHISVREYPDLIMALRSIAAGKTSLDRYKNVSSPYRERLRYAQSQRDQGQKVNPKQIAKMNYQQMERPEKKKGMVGMYYTGT